MSASPRPDTPPMLPVLPRVVLVACGCFNPPTIAHMRMFELARDHLRNMRLGNVVKGIISPTGDGYTKPGLLSAKHRLEMCRISTDHLSWMETDTWEATQPTWQTTRLVLKHFDETLNKDKPAEEKVKVKLLCGADLMESFQNLQVWKEGDIERIIQDHGIVCVNRGAISDANVLIRKQPVLFRNMWNITVLSDWLQSDISSTLVRAAARRHDSVRLVVPPGVSEYILEHRLYADSPPPSLL